MHLKVPLGLVNHVSGLTGGVYECTSLSLIVGALLNEKMGGSGKILLSVGSLSIIDQLDRIMFLMCLAAVLYWVTK